MADWAKDDRPRDVLHFAPEWGTERVFRTSPRVRRYVTTDLSAPNVDVQSDITDLRFAEQSFDVIICTHVLEHIPDDRAAMRELFRVLRPQGVAYILVPYRSDQATDEDASVTDPQERARRYGQFDHLRTYGTDFAERLAGAGFDVKELCPVRQMDAATAARCGVWDDTIFRCERLLRGT